MNNSLPAHLINLATLQLVRLLFRPYRSLKKKQEAPLLVSGAFRSGTSITTLILSKAGFDIGPQGHLIQAKGKFYELNPDGYMENFFFMELSMYLFKLTDSRGDHPPPPYSVNQIDIKALSDDALRKHSLLITHDDRVSNWNKLRVLRKASVHHMQEYLSNVYGEKPLIKNPHFSVLEPFFEKIFPDSKRIVVFRDPGAWLESVQVVTKKADMKLYDEYYRHYLESTAPGIIFFNYDRLLASPEDSIAALLSALNIPASPASELAKLVRQKEKRKTGSGYAPLTYTQLLERAINR